MDIGKSAGRSWALYMVAGMIAFAAIAVLYVVFAATSKPEGQEQGREGYARFAHGALAHLAVMPEPPPMPPDTLRGAHGEGTTLAQLADGHVTVLNLWATWCAPCMSEMPTLGALQRRFAGRGLKVLAVSVDSEAHVVEAEAKLRDLTLSTLDFYADPTRAILFSAQASGIPATLIYDRRGREIARLVGGADWGGDDVAAFIEAALAAP